MRLEIDIPEHHYNNIMAFDSVSFGRVPYKGIIMYTINAIKHGRVLEQEPTTKNDLGVDCIKKSDAINIIQNMTGYARSDVVSDAVNRIITMPSVTQEPKTGHWREDIDNNRTWDRVRFYCSECGGWQTYGKTDYCPNCGCRMVEPQESEVEDATN